MSEAIVDPPTGRWEVDLTELVAALTDAVDLVAVDSVGHGKRVAFMTMEIARRARLPAEDVDELFLAAMLHDCGVSSTAVHRQLLASFDWEGSATHCQDGFRLLRGFAPLARVAEVVLLHHVHWEDLVAQGEPTPESWMANAVYLADRIDALVGGRAGADLLMARDEIRATVAASAATRFAPALVAAFLEISTAEAFWLSLEPRHLDRFVADQTHCARRRTMGWAGVRRFAAILARIVDDKSHFTAAHSRGVARLARLLGELRGMAEADCDLLEVAGLLHDLGKLRVPDEILDKPARLDESEFAAMRGHTFETYQILSRVAALRPVAEVAAFHHEAITGRGYPFHRHDDELSQMARIVSVADIFQALGQVRPYRPSLSAGETLAIMRDKADRGDIDESLVDLVAANVDRCRAAAFDDRDGHGHH